MRRAFHVSLPAAAKACIAVAAAACALAWVAAAAHAGPAPWYYWRSTLDGARVCAQTSPGAAWKRDSDAYDGPGCQPRRKVLIIPMR